MHQRVQRIHQFKERHHPRMHQRVQRIHQLKFQIMKRGTNGCGEFTNSKKDIIHECAKTSPVEIPDHERMHQRVRRIHQFEERHHPRMQQRVQRIHQFEREWLLLKKLSSKDAQRVENLPTWWNWRASSKRAPTFTNLKKGIKNEEHWRKTLSKHPIHQLEEIKSRLCNPKMHQRVR